MMRAAILVLFASFGTALAQPAPRAPVPSAGDVEKADKLVRELYKADLAKKKFSDQIETVKKLVKAANETKDDMAAKFALYREAGDLACRAGDLGAALEAAAGLLQHFDVKPVEAQLNILQAADRAKAMPARAVADASVEVAEEAVRADDYASAMKLLKLATGAAVRANLSTTATNVAARQKEVEGLEQLFTQLAADRKKLETDANAAEANFKIGKFVALRKGDWDAALPLLAKASDEKWKAAAEQELTAALAGDMKLALADRWFDLGASFEGAEAGELRLHAYQWYAQSAADLTGLSKTRAEKRMQDLEKSPEFKSAPGAGWRVLFRSAEPSIWNTETNRGRYQFAVPVAKAPVGLRYLRLAETTKGTSVIIEMTKDRLDQASDKDGYGWNGQNGLEHKGHHLGIYDMASKNIPKGTIAVFNVPFQPYRGWGFGNRAFIDDIQGYSWAGEQVQRAVFEIAVKVGPLSADESKRLLKKKK